MGKLSVDQALLLASSHVKKGEIADAKKVFQAVLKAFPKNKRAQQGLAEIYNRDDGPVLREPDKKNIDDLLNLYGQNELDLVFAKAKALTEQYPESIILWNIIGVSAAQIGYLDQAVRAFRNILSFNPNHIDAHYNLGKSLQEQNDLEGAILAYQQALSLKPDHVDAFFNMGNALHEQGEFEKAIAAFQKALSIQSDYPAAHNNMGNALLQQDKFPEAISAYKQAVSLQPEYAAAYNNMGTCFHEQGKLSEAIEAYKRAISIDPSYVAAHNNIGSVLLQQGKSPDAISAFKRAIALNPEFAEAYVNLAAALREQGDLGEAIDACKKVLELEPDFPEAEALKLSLEQHVCNFEISSQLVEASKRLGITTRSVRPFGGLAWADNPSEQLQRAQKWAQEKYTKAVLPLPKPPTVRPKRLKIGYFSADFHDHATMLLMAGVFRHHNYADFEVHIYSYGRIKTGNWRARISRYVDHYFEVEDMSDSELADFARSHGLNVAIDLKGYTKYSRTGVFQYRLAPIQINFLGYPGSMGTDFIDYIVADPVVISGEQRDFYSERIIYLPNSYFPNDREREIASTETSRADFGLPEGAFVFCCFNSNYKIGMREFCIWMRLLGLIDDSVLWLLKSNSWAERNLRSEAERQGVDPKRLIFAEKIANTEHLARHKHADLFLDTFAVNAHTTACDALWSGLPVVTKLGQQFAARVAASLLTAVGLPELIARSEECYEQLILELARNPLKLRDVKAKLGENRLKAPLFDTKSYIRTFETGITRACDLCFNQQERQDIWVFDS